MIPITQSPIDAAMAPNSMSFVIRDTYILKEKEGIRQHLRSERKETAVRYYQLMTGHAAIAPYLKNKVENGDSEEYWSCQSGKKQSREHLFKECPKWNPQIRELWRRVGKDVGWQRAKWKSVAQLFKEERAEKAVVEFIRKTGVGRMSGTSRLEVDQEESDKSDTER
jgi:hypothetical protein